MSWALALVLLAAPPSTEEQLVTRSARLMGTQVTISVWTQDTVAARRTIQDAFSVMKALEQVLSVWVPGSDVSRLNASAGGAGVAVSQPTFDVLAAAQTFSALSGGKFDITFGALSGLWKFDHDQDNRIPSPQAIARRLPLVDHRQVILDAKAKTAALGTKGMKVHLGGIGKGYAVDRMVERLRGDGFQNFMIQAGGDLFASGMRGPRKWRVGVRDPRGPPSAYFASCEVHDETFSTSGDYERFFIEDGVRYHHILDPQSGTPARTVQSVTVMAPSAMSADALSTSVFLLGVEKGLRLIENTAGAGAVIVDLEGQVHMSERLRPKLTLLRAPTPPRGAQSKTTRVR